MPAIANAMIAQEMDRPVIDIVGNRPDESGICRQVGLTAKDINAKPRHAGSLAAR
jgi:hypothetical protein